MKKMTVKIEIDLENQQFGVTEVKTNTNIQKLLHMGGAEFLSMIFDELSKAYKKKAKLD